MTMRKTPGPKPAAVGTTLLAGAFVHPPASASTASATSSADLVRALGPRTDGQGTHVRVRHPGGTGTTARTLVRNKRAEVVGHVPARSL
ncbi:hypothetical protein [Streptomyces sp. NPDC049590]|uniref:hypothetical protein n=1 Tax=Streptomyces sp. NPDC049590 TaxID=3154834 RepID=UPI003423C095